METVVIEGKEYKCSKRVAEEISWMDNQVKTAKKLAQMIEDEMDEFETQFFTHQNRMNDLVNQLKKL